MWILNISGNRMLSLAAQWGSLIENDLRDGCIISRHTVSVGIRQRVAAVVSCAVTTKQHAETEGALPETVFICITFLHPACICSFSSSAAWSVPIHTLLASWLVVAVSGRAREKQLEGLVWEDCSSPGPEVKNPFRSSHMLAVMGIFADRGDLGSRCLEGNSSCKNLFCEAEDLYHVADKHVITVIPL